ncbi:MAG: alpha/beta fold hydrolase [bacterium]
MQAIRFSVGGQALHGELHEAEGGAKGGVVLVHGFNSSLGEFGGLAPRLARAGYDVLAFDQRGYGSSEGERGRTSVEAAVQDIEAAAAVLRNRLGRKPIGIVGHSLGGAYAIAAMARTDLFQAGVAAHPLDRLFDELKWFEKMGYHVIGKRAERKMAKGKAAGTIPYKLSYEKLFVSKEAARAARADAFLLGRVSLANYRPALTMSASTWAREVRKPVLVVSSPHDRAVRPAHTRAVFGALAGPKEFIEHGGGHSCFRDVDGERLANETAAWLDRWMVPS